MKMANIGLRFRGKYKLLNGKDFFGQILDIPDTSRVSNFFSARRYLRVNRNSEIKPTDVVIVDKQKYIVGDHGTGFFKDSIYKHFKLFYVDLELNIYRRTETVNPVTGVKQKSSKSTSIGKAYLSVQPKGSLNDSINIPTPQHVVISDKQLFIDDLLGDHWIVTDVDYQLGIYVAEVKEK